MARGNIASGLLLVILGVWLGLQTLGGDLPRRLLSLTGVKASDSAKDPLGLPCELDIAGCLLGKVI